MAAVLVTGGLGFTGRHIVRLLADSGHPVVSYNRDYAESELPSVRAVQGELYDIPRLLSVIREHKVTSIVHTAAMSHPTLSLDFPIATFAANVEGTVAIYEAARLSGVQRIVNFSSETVYGRIDGAVSEKSPVNPSTPYAVTKVTTELLGDVYRQRFGIGVVSLRIAEVYGPGNKMPEILTDMLRALSKTNRFELDHGSDHYFNFIFTEDVARAALAAVQASGPFSGSVFNISSDEYWRLADVVELIKDCVFPGCSIRVGAGLMPDLDLQGPFDVTAARQELGFSPSYGLKMGLQSYATHLKSNPF
jgi:UDP-glucose 4-epimerase